MSLQLRKLADRSGDPPPEGEAWPLAGVTITGDPPEIHQFATSFVTRAAAEGWLTLGRGKITIHAETDVTWTITEEPGAYCDLCDARIGDGPATTSEQAAPRLAHVADCDGSNDPSPENPAGYRVTDYYLSELEI